MVTKRIALVFAVALALPAADVGPALAVSATGADRPVPASDGRAQTLSPDRRPVRQMRPRVEIHPDRLLRRECVDATREIWRPYWGYVVTPGMRCWWVRQ
jgi:hypothetical protein